MDTRSEATKRFYRRYWKWLLGIGSILFCCLVCFIVITVYAYRANNDPVYVELDFPLPSRYAETIRSIFTWSDTGDNYFLWRRQMYVFEEFTTWDAIINYFDKYLIPQGWKRYDTGSSACMSYMPETKFLPLSENGYIFYRRADKDQYQSGPTVCLAVWPLDDSDLRFNVVLLTVNPSSWARVREDNN